MEDAVVEKLKDLSWEKGERQEELEAREVLSLKLQETSKRLLTPSHPSSGLCRPVLRGQLQDLGENLKRSLTGRQWGRRHSPAQSSTLALKRKCALKGRKTVVADEKMKEGSKSFSLDLGDESTHISAEWVNSPLRTLWLLSWRSRTQSCWSYRLVPSSVESFSKVTGHWRVRSTTILQGLGRITTINCSGNIWVEPATVLHVGTSVSIYCRAVIKNCQPTKLNFYKNGFKESDKITEMNRTTARLSYENFLEPRISVYCTAQCPGHFQETLICGKDIFSGYPPDAPDEVMCVIYEYSGHMTCTWNAGRLTHLDTKYVVRVKSLETEEEQQYVTASYANISTDSLQGGRKYLVWVQAVNALGMAESPQLQVHLDDIVIPSASIISSAETIDATVAKTIIHWNSKTMIEKVSCKMRYKATTNQTWSVKEFDTNFTHVQQTDFYLEPNIKYEFQVRCQETGKRYWQPWSSPFVYRTPETVPQVTPKSSRGDAQNSGMPTATVFKRYLTSDKSQDIRLLSGMVFLAIILPTISLIGIFNRSLRRGIKRKILLLIPKWLHEDIPNMENSNAVKMLQEKNVFVYSNASEDALSVDPVITEISEIFLPAHKPTDYKEEKLMLPLETRDCLQASLSTSSIVYIPDLNAGYKPQISSFHPGENHLNPSYEADSTPDLPSHFCGLGNNVRLKMYPRLASSVSSMNSLSNTLVFEELSLLLNRGECNSPDTQNSGEEETTMFLESDSSKDTLPEQTLLPDEFVSCLATGSEALPSINSYFPQNILESHFSEISLLQK